MAEEQKPFIAFFPIERNVRVKVDGGKLNGDQEDFDFKFEMPELSSATIGYVSVDISSEHQTRNRNDERTLRSFRCKGQVYSKGNFGAGGMFEARILVIFAVAVQEIPVGKNLPTADMILFPKGNAGERWNVMSQSISGLKSKAFELAPNARFGSAIVSTYGAKRCVDTPGPENGRRVHYWDPHGRKNQLWDFEDVGDGYVRIISIDNGRVLDADNNTISNDGCEIQLWDWNGGDHQKWKLENQGEGVFKIRNKKANRCLSLELKIEEIKLPGVGQKIRRISDPGNDGKLKLRSEAEGVEQRWHIVR